jgi:galactitol-specific phosphotransferase system IIB component
MAGKKLIVCVCGAAILTSKMAEMFIQNYLEEKKLTKEYKVETCQIDKLALYGGRKNIVVCWMGPIDEKFGAPGVQGPALMVGTKKEKIALVKKIIELMEANYTS